MPRTTRPGGLLAVVTAVALASATGAVITLASPAAAASHEVQITDSAFATPVLTVQVGDTVTWNNVDDRPHTVTSEDGTFDSGNVDEGASFSFTFDQPGTYAYICEYHPDMRATIVVEPASTGETAQAAPTATPADPGSATPAPTGHTDDHAAAGSQPDTALPGPASIPVAALLLWGLGLIGLAVGLMPSRATTALVPRPRGGWRR